MIWTATLDLVRRGFVPAPAPAEPHRTPRAGVVYTYVCFAVMVAALAGWHALDIAWPLNAPTWTVALFLPVGVLSGILARREDDELAVTNYMTVVCGAMLIVHGPIMAAMVATVLSLLIDIPQWRIMDRVENVVNVAFELLYVLVAGTAFLLVWRVTGGVLALSAFALGAAGTLANGLVFAGYARACAQPMGDIVSGMRGRMSQSVIETCYTAMGAAAFLYEPVLIFGLLVPPMLTRYAEWHKEEADRARQELIIDSLTGLRTRGNFWSQLETRLLDARAGGSNVGLVMCDIDNFKILNDSHGHVEGDRALIACANALDAVAADAPGRAWAFRYGGEEMAVIVLGVDGDIMFELGERMRAASAAALSPWGTTLSLGVGMAEGDLDAHDFVERIDRALYVSKHSGKDRVSRADPLDAPVTGLSLVQPLADAA